jgi:hypothetical protein
VSRETVPFQSSRLTRVMPRSRAWALIAVREATIFVREPSAPVDRTDNRLPSIIHMGGLDRNRTSESIRGTQR